MKKIAILALVLICASSAASAWVVLTKLGDVFLSVGQVIGSAASAVNVYLHNSADYEELGYFDVWGAESKANPKKISVPAYATLRPDENPKNAPAYRLNVEASIDDVWNEAQSNPQNYPNLVKAGQDQVAVSPGPAAWGQGDEFDAALVPQVGDYIVNPDGPIAQITSIGPCTLAPLDWRDGGCTLHNNTQSRSPGSVGWYFGSCPPHRSPMFVWGGCGHINSSTGRTTYGRHYTFSAPSAPPELDDTQKRQAIEAAPGEAVRAVIGATVSKFGRELSYWPPGSGSPTITDPETGGTPNTEKIVSQLTTAKKVLGDTGTVVKSTTGETQIVSESDPTITTTINPETGDTITTKTTTKTTTDSDGNIVKTETVTERTVTDQNGNELGRSTETETNEEIPKIDTPDLAKVDWTPFTNLANVLRNRIPTTFFMGLIDLISHFYTVPEVPEFDVALGPFSMKITLAFMEYLATIVRNILAFLIYWFAVREAAYIWIQ